jgi:hypothetical protein
MKHIQWPWVVITLSLVISYLLAGFHPALAIGPGTGGSKVRVDSQPVGPYVLLVATAPLPVMVGQMSIWVQVIESETESLLRDAIVTIEATPQNGSPTLTAQATHQNAGNNFDYVAHLDVEETGPWNFTVYVQDQPGEAEVSFVETVTSGRSLGALIELAIPFIVLALVVGIYLWRRSMPNEAN